MTIVMDNGWDVNKGLVLMINLCESVAQVEEVEVCESLNEPILCSLIQAEWLAAQRDGQGIADLEDVEEDGVSFSYWI